MYKYLVIIIAAFMLTSGCKTGKNSTKQDTVVISLQKTACKGKCPVYKLEIYNSGELKFEGKSNVENIGSFSMKITKEKVDELVEKFIAANFFEFEDEYTSKVTDLPSTYLTFTHNNKTKRVRDYHGAPEQLRELEKLIEAFVNSENWQKIK